MPLPGDLSSVIVTGQFTSASGVPVPGRVTFTPTATLLDPTSSAIIPASPAVYPLSAAGQFVSDPLIATDNADIEPSGWAYTVLVELQDLAPYTFTCFLPSSPSTVDMSALEPVFPAGTLAPAITGNYLPAGGGTETGTLVLDGSPPLRIPAGATAGYILISDASGNFTPQANPGGSGGSANSIDGVTVSGITVAGRVIMATGPSTATWQLPLQLDFTNADVQPLAATGLASSSAGLSGPPGITQAAVADHVHPTTGLVVSGESASGDLGGTYPSPTVTATHLASALPVNQGGTGSTTQNFVDLSTNQTGAGSIGGDKTFTGTATFSGEIIVPAPTNATDAATKAYADSIASGFTGKFSAVTATVGTETITISGGTVTQIAGTTLDGQSPQVGDQVLIKDAPAATGTGSALSSQPGNGLYVVTGNTTNLSVARAASMSGSNSPAGAFVFVEAGTVSAGRGYTVTTPSGSGSFTYGSGAIQWTQFSSAGAVTADGTTLSQSGSVLSLITPVSIAHGGTGTATGAPQNDVFAGPSSGGGGAPLFRSLVAGDMSALLDTTAGDIQASPGTAAAGSQGLAADAKHVHPSPSVFAPGGLTGATQPSRYVGSTTSGAPASGTFSQGDWVVSRSDGNLYVCTTAGTVGSGAVFSQAGGSSSAPVPVNHGGTGATTAAAAVSALGAADLTSAQTLTTKTLKNTSLTFDNLGTVSTSQSLSCANGNVQEFTLGASIAVTAITGPGGSVACDLTLYIKQASSGGPYSITSWPSSITWLGGSAPTIQTAANAVTVLTFESLNGGTAWYGAQITGAPSLPLGIPLGGTGATDSNDALAALAGQGILSIFGNGNDGALVFDGSTTPVAGATLSGSTYTLTRDVLATSITVNSGVTVRTSSGASGTFRIFCQGTVTNAGTITAAGNPASGATAGAALASGSFIGGRAGGAGGAAGTGAGTAGAGAEIGVAGGTGGNGGGGGAGGAGGAAVQPGTSVLANVLNTPFPLLTGVCFYGGFTLQIGFGAGGGGGGGATGAAGGGGGGGGGIVAIFAYSVINNGTITVAGGAGAQGAGGNAGGGGGGAGGLIFICTLSAWTAGTTVITGGAGGALSGTGTAGAAGGTGFMTNLVLTS